MKVREMVIKQGHCCPLCPFSENCWMMVTDENCRILLGLPACSRLQEVNLSFMSCIFLDQMFIATADHTNVLNIISCFTSKSEFIAERGIVKMIPNWCWGFILMICLNGGDWSFDTLASIKNGQELGWSPSWNTGKEKFHRFQITSGLLLLSLQGMLFFFVETCQLSPHLNWILSWNDEFQRERLAERCSHAQMQLSQKVAHQLASGATRYLAHTQGLLIPYLQTCLVKGQSVHSTHLWITQMQKRSFRYFSICWKQFAALEVCILFFIFSKDLTGRELTKKRIPFLAILFICWKLVEHFFSSLTNLRQTWSCSCSDCEKKQCSFLRACGLFGAKNGLHLHEWCRGAQTTKWWRIAFVNPEEFAGQDPPLSKEAFVPLDQWQSPFPLIKAAFCFVFITHKYTSIFEMRGIRQDQNRIKFESIIKTYSQPRWESRTSNFRLHLSTGFTLNGMASQRNEF